MYGLEYGLRGFHVKRVLSIEYGTNYIVFMANVLLSVIEYGLCGFHGKRVISIEYRCRLYRVFIANVSVLDGVAVETMVRMILWASALCKIL